VTDLAPAAPAASGVRPTSEVGPSAPSTGWNRDASPWLALILAIPLLVMIALAVVYPLYQLVKASISDEGWSSYSDYFESRANVRALVRTLVASLITTVVTVGIGTILAWTLRTARSTAARVVLWLSVLIPVWMGVIVKNYAFLVILGRRGIVNTVLVELGIVDEPARILYTPTAVVIGMVYTMLPYAVLPMFANLQTVPTELPVAAESLGATRSRAIRTVVLPLAVPGLLATGVIVFVLSLGFYLTPVILGGTQGTFVAVLVQGDIFTRFDYPGAATSGTILVLVATIILSLSFLAFGGERLKRVMA
jgi:putative spermidine/putrescine transport system permease protein